MFKVGDKVKIIGNTSGHSYLTGYIGTITCISGNNHYINNSTYVFPADIVKVVLSIEDLRKEEADLITKINELKNAINYMERSGAKEYCKEEHAMFRKADQIVSAVSLSRNKAALLSVVFNILTEKNSNG